MIKVFYFFRSQTTADNRAILLVTLRLLSACDARSSEATSSSCLQGHCGWASERTGLEEVCINSADMHGLDFSHRGKGLTPKPKVTRRSKDIKFSCMHNTKGDTQRLVSNSSL